MPFYYREFWSDLNVQSMTWEQRGIYHHLLGCCWMEGSIPSEPDDLSSILRVDRKHFDKIWPRILKCFTSQDGRLIQRKVEKIRKAKEDYAEERSKSGRRGAEVRHNLATRDPSCNDGSAIAQPSTRSSSAINQPLAKNSLPTSDFRLPTSEAAATAVAADSVSIDDTGWPKFTEAIRSKFPTTDDRLIRKIVEETVRVYPPVTDDNLVSAFMAASESDRKQYSPALYVQTIPRVIKSWIVH